MQLSLHLNLSAEEREWVETKFRHLHNDIVFLTERFDAMSAELDALTAQVQATNGVMASAVVLINGLSAQLAQIQEELDQQAVVNVRLNELKAALDQGDDAIQALLSANAPAPAPAPTEAPAPAPTEPPAVDPNQPQP